MTTNWQRLLAASERHKEPFPRLTDTLEDDKLPPWTRSLIKSGPLVISFWTQKVGGVKMEASKWRRRNGGDEMEETKWRLQNRDQKTVLLDGSRQMEKATCMIQTVSQEESTK